MMSVTRPFFRMGPAGSGRRRRRRIPSKCLTWVRAGRSRALAHPLRLKLHTLVGREGSVTAAQAARELGISQALASHHLRQLAKYGFIERADAGDERERPWRVTATSYSWEAAATDLEGAG